MNEGNPVKKGARRRLWFWLVVFLIAVSVQIQHTMARASQTMDILQPVLEKDFRFSKVRISRTSTFSVLVSGEVRSGRDLIALNDLIRGNTTSDGTPLHPVISVAVSSNSN